MSDREGRRGEDRDVGIYGEGQNRRDIWEYWMAECQEVKAYRV